MLARRKAAADGSAGARAPRKADRPMAELTRFQMLIGGKAVGAISGRTFESQNPYTGQSWAVLPDGGPEDVNAAGGTASPPGRPYFRSGAAACPAGGQ